MRLTKKSLASILVLLLTATTLFAQKNLSDWNIVEKLKPGARIVVITKNGREFDGEKRQSTPDTLFLETRFAIQGNRTISISRDEIAEVRKVKSHKFLPIITTAIGIGVGVAFGAAADRPGTDDPNMGKLVGGLLGGLGGLTGGAVISKVAKKAKP